MKTNKDLQIYLNTPIYFPDINSSDIIVCINDTPYPLGTKYHGNFSLDYIHTMGYIVINKEDNPEYFL